MLLFGAGLWCLVLGAPVQVNIKSPLGTYNR